LFPLVSKNSKNGKKSEGLKEKKETIRRKTTVLRHFSKGHKHRRTTMKRKKGKSKEKKKKKLQRNVGEKKEEGGSEGNK